MNSSPQDLGALDEEARWVTLHVHGRDVAIEEGILIPRRVPFEGRIIEIALTDRVEEKYGQSADLMQDIIYEGLTSLGEPSAGDSDFQRVRLVGEDIVLVQSREGITFMDSRDFGGSEALSELSLQPAVPEID